MIVVCLDISDRISQHQTILGKYCPFLQLFPEDTVKCAWLFLWGVGMGGCPDDMKPKNPRKKADISDILHPCINVFLL